MQKLYHEFYSLCIQKIWYYKKMFLYPLEIKLCKNYKYKNICNLTYNTDDTKNKKKIIKYKFFYHQYI